MKKNEPVEIKQVPTCGQIEVKLTKKKYWRDPITLWWIRNNGTTKLTPKRWSSFLKVAIRKGILDIVNLKPDISKFNRAGTYIGKSKPIKVKKKIKVVTKSEKGTKLESNKVITVSEKVKTTNIITKSTAKVVKDDRNK